jgi:hypothetical protein
MVANLLWAQEEHTRDLPAEPWVFGVVGFVVLLALIAGVLVFGKGRPHA